MIPMILILAAILILAVLSHMLCVYSIKGYKTRHDLAGLAGVVFGIASVLSALIYIYAGFCWFAAYHQANIINREYGANYTQAEVFFASEVIDTVRELDRKRIELNGDLMRESDRQ